MVLILGSKGMLGGQLMKVFGNEAVGWDRDQIDVTNPAQLKYLISNFQFPISSIINCVAYNDVDRAEENQELAFKLNSDVPKNLSAICNQLDIPFVHFSTNYVFDGEKGEYRETDKPNPQSVYARSKYQGEQNVVNNSQKYYLVRTAVLFGPKGESELSKKSFVDLMLDLSQKNDTIKAVDSEINSLTYAPDLAVAVRVLLSQQFAFGIYHLANEGQASWYHFAQEIFRIKNLKTNLTAVSSSEFPRRAQRPKKSVLLNTKFIHFRPWQEALREFLNLKKSNS